MDPLKRGDYVRLTIGTWTCDAMVGLASENGRSLIVMFDGAAPVAGGLALGMLALLRDDDAPIFRSLIGGDIVDVTSV